VNPPWSSPPALCPAPPPPTLPPYIVQGASAHARSIDPPAHVKSGQLSSLVSAPTPTPTPKGNHPFRHRGLPLPPRPRQQHCHRPRHCPPRRFRLGRPDPLDPMIGHCPDNVTINSPALPSPVSINKPKPVLPLINSSPNPPSPPSHLGPQYTYELRDATSSLNQSMQQLRKRIGHLHAQIEAMPDMRKCIGQHHNLRAPTSPTELTGGNRNPPSKHHRLPTSTPHHNNSRDNTTTSLLKPPHNLANTNPFPPDPPTQTLKPPHKLATTTIAYPLYAIPPPPDPPAYSSAHSMQPD